MSRHRRKDRAVRERDPAHRRSDGPERADAPGRGGGGQKGRRGAGEGDGGRDRGSALHGAPVVRPDAEKPSENEGASGQDAGGQGRERGTYVLRPDRAGAEVGGRGKETQRKRCGPDGEKQGF